MPLHDLVVIGGSAGALQALTSIVELLPPTLPACVLIVVHTRAERDGLLPGLLQRHTKLPVTFAADGDRLKPSHIYVAPPDRHLLVTSSGLRLVHGPRENGFRPAVDPLFRTASRERGARVIGVILSGGLSDGTYGLSLIKQYGGVAIVQDPDEAAVDSMPRSALASVDIDFVARAAEIPLIIERVSRQPADKGEDAMAHSNDLEPQLLSEERTVAEMEQRFGRASSLTCPDCGGALWEIKEGRGVRYECHVGHQYGSDGLEAGQRDAVDNALWTAVRVLEEHAALKTGMARRSSTQGLSNAAQGFEEGARDAHRQAQQIRALLVGGGGRDVKKHARRAAAAARAPAPRKIRRTKAKD